MAENSLETKFKGINNKFVMTSHIAYQLSSSETIAANSGKWASYDFTKAGYYPIEVVGWGFDGTNGSTMTVYGCYLQSRPNKNTARVRCEVRSWASNVSNSHKFTIYILWIKEE